MKGKCLVGIDVNDVVTMVFGLDPANLKLNIRIIEEDNCYAMIADYDLAMAALRMGVRIPDPRVLAGFSPFIVE